MQPVQWSFRQNPHMQGGNRSAVGYLRRFPTRSVGDFIVNIKIRNLLGWLRLSVRYVFVLPIIYRTQNTAVAWNADNPE